ncbi:MAG: DUF4342 domain-containing protein [Anaerolineae bacterium]
MSEEEKTAETGKAKYEADAGQADAGEGKAWTETEEIKVQAQDLFRTINELIREGTIRRITVMRDDRVLLDLPLVVGVPLGLILATQLTFLSAVVGVGALLGGCTVRIERDEPTEDE